MGQELLLITLGEVWITRYSNFDKGPEDYKRVDKEYTDQIIYYNWYGSSTKQGDVAIFITGGIDERDNALMSSAIKYDNETDKWSHLQGMNMCRAYHASCVMGTKLYVFAGIIPEMNEPT